MRVTLGILLAAAGGAMFSVGMLKARDLLNNPQSLPLVWLGWAIISVLGFSTIVGATYWYRNGK